MSVFVIARNALFNLLAFGVTVLVTLLLVPVMLLHLGPTAFGAWAIVRVFVNYASLADFGLSSTVTKFVAELHAKKDEQGIVRVIYSAFLIYFMIAALLLAILYLVQYFLLTTFFSTSGTLLEDIRFILFGSMIIFSGNLIFSIFSSAIAGIQRMDTTNVVLSVFWIVNGILMYLAIVSGLGLRGLVYANAAATALSILLNAFFFFKFFRHLPFFSVRAGFVDLKESLRYSKDIFVIAAANGVHLHFDKLLLSSFLSLSMVSNYEVASGAIQLMRRVPILLLNPVLPASSELHAQQKSESVRRLYYFSLKYIMVLEVPVFVCVGVFAHPLITIWLGEGKELIATTLQVLIIPNFVNLMTGPAYFISLGVGKASYGMYSSIVGLVVNIALSFFLLLSFGYFGAVAGTFVALLIEAFLFLSMFHRALGIRWAPFLSMFLHPIGAATVAVLVAEGIGAFVTPIVLKTVVMVCSTVAVYVFALLKPPYFGEDDRALLKEFRAKIAEKFLAISERY